jgi:hypothetical protein
MSSSVTCPEELELLLEDACLLSDISLLSTLFDNDAVLLTRASIQVRWRSAIAEVIIDHVRGAGSCVAAPQVVMQSAGLR